MLTASFEKALDGNRAGQRERPEHRLNQGGKKKHITAGKCNKTKRVENYEEKPLQGAVFYLFLRIEAKNRAENQKVMA